MIVFEVPSTMAAKVIRPPSDRPQTHHAGHRQSPPFQPAATPDNMPPTQSAEEDGQNRRQDRNAKRQDAAYQAGNRLAASNGFFSARMSVIFGHRASFSIECTGAAHEVSGQGLALTPLEDSLRARLYTNGQVI